MAITILFLVCFENHKIKQFRELERNAKYGIYPIEHTINININRKNSNT